MFRSRWKNNGGFTLIELLVAVALAAALLAALYATFFTVAGSGRAAAESAEGYVEAGRFLERLTSEVRSARFARDDPRTFFAGAVKKRHSEIAFTSNAHPAAAALSPTSDLIAVVYRVDRDGESRRIVKEMWNPYLGEKVSFTAVSDISGLEVSFFNGKDWSKAWDASVEGGLPKAVMVRLTLASGEELALSASPKIR